MTRDFLGVLCVFNNKTKIYKEMTTASRLTTRTNEGGGRRQKPDTLQKSCWLCSTTIIIIIISRHGRSARNNSENVREMDGNYLQFFSSFSGTLWHTFRASLSLFPHLRNEHKSIICIELCAPNALN